jgi:hypothetical protein
MIRRARSIAVVVALALSIAGCDYYTQAKGAADSGGPVPWFCNPVAPNSVTGPGMGTVDFYAGQSRQPLDHQTCMTVARQFDQAKAYAELQPTLGGAEAAGFISTFGFIGGMGTHHGLGALTPEMFADPNFDRDNPDMPAGSIIDDVFDPARPEFLQYNGNGDDAVLVGISYYVRTDTGRPPEGFAGGNDWWHHHPTLCFDAATAQAFAAAIGDAACASRGGVNVRMDDYYMLHIWLVDDLEYHADVHAPMHPCITGSGAIFDMDDPCHDSWQGAGSAASAAPAGHAGHAGLAAAGPDHPAG